MSRSPKTSQVQLHWQVQACKPPNYPTGHKTADRTGTGIMTDKEEQITVTEAARQLGQHGGIVTRDRYAGTDFYRRIGAKGGRKTAELYADLLKEFGKKGGRPRRPTLDEPTGEQDRD